MICVRDGKMMCTLRENRCDSVSVRLNAPRCVGCGRMKGKERRKIERVKAYAVWTFRWLHSVSGSCTWILGRGRLCCPVPSFVAVFVVTWMTNVIKSVLVWEPRRRGEQLGANRGEWLKGALRKFKSFDESNGQFFLSRCILFRAIAPEVSY